MDLQEETNFVDDVQCFTIREIEGIIRALAQKKIFMILLWLFMGQDIQKNKGKIKIETKKISNIKKH
jgi:hypothetical protein